MIADRLPILADEIHKQILRYQSQRDHKIRRLWLVLVPAILLLTTVSILVSIGVIDLGFFWNICGLVVCGSLIGFGIHYALVEVRWLRERTEWVTVQLKVMLDDMEMRTREWGEEFAEREFRHYFERYYSIRFEAFERNPKWNWLPSRFSPSKSA